MVALASYWRAYRKMSMAPVESPIVLGTQDMILIVSCFIEILAISFMGPKLGAVNFLLSRKLDHLDDDQLFKDYFYNLLTLSYSVIVLGTLSLILAGTRLNCKEDMHMLGCIVNRYLFIPVIYILFLTFRCSEAASDSQDFELQDSFMDVDCSENCWEGTHLIYSSTAAVVFLFLSLISIPCSAYLVNSLPNCQFEMSPRSLLVRIPFLTLFVSLNSLPLIAHSIGYLVVLVGYTYVCTVLKTLALPRIDFLNSLCLAALFLVSFFQSIYDLAFPNYWVCLALALLAVVVLMLVGLILIKKLPNLLKTTHRIHTGPLFSFAFKPKAVFPKSRIYRIVSYLSR
mmetsp:Transcript_33972/g.59196  ORF Transcript_33972/g.59196 Transcript_33972/m.59196 type:complete len:342 (-) Transcript_33972:984-2009(-)